MIMRAVCLVEMVCFAVFLFGCASSSSITEKNQDRRNSVNKALMLELINSHRIGGCDCGTEGVFGPARLLIWNDTLEMAAFDHCLDMNTNKFFGHTGSDGSTSGNRMDRRGYNWRACAENIAVNSSEERTVKAWIESPGHCRNIMNPNYTEIGAARVGNYWTLVLGTRK